MTARSYRQVQRTARTQDTIAVTRASAWKKKATQTSSLELRSSSGTASRGDPLASYVAVHASRGKVVRAEPISALHETGKIKYVGNFDELEDECCAMTTYGYMGEGSPNRVDAKVWAFTELFPGITRPPVEKNIRYTVPNKKRF